MNKEEIYNALDSSWWTVSEPNQWLTSYVSANITFTNASGKNLTYISEAPYITYGLNQSGNTTTYDSNTGVLTPSNASTLPSNDNGVNTLTTLVDSLREQASQRLYDMHCTSIVSNSELSSEFGGQA